MNQSTRIPASLTIVAVLFILGGISSVLDILLSLAHHHINLNFGVLGLFIGFGLFRLSPGWRTCALFFTWIGILCIPVVALIMLAHAGPLDLNFFGQRVGSASKGLGLLLCMVSFLYSIWQYRVLTRPDVRALFRLPPH